jgi:hypothetical protein
LPAPHLIASSGDENNLSCMATHGQLVLPGARLSWNYVPSEENNKVFGRDRPFVAGSRPVWYLRFMVKDPKKYTSTGGWGYGDRLLRWRGFVA